MPKTAEIVINTSPLIALVAAWGNLNYLADLYEQVWVPLEVHQEILHGGKSQFAVPEFEQASWLRKQIKPLEISPFLLNALDLGEASVIQLALK
jgi:predicted nucleic acid-binding protein